MNNLVSVWYCVNGSEYFEMLGINEIDPMAEMWNNVTRIEYENQICRTQKEVTDFLNDNACFIG